MIGDILKKIFGDKSAKDKKLYWPYAEQAIAAWEAVKSLSDNELRFKTNEFNCLTSPPPLLALPILPGLAKLKGKNHILDDR